MRFRRTAPMSGFVQLKRIPPVLRNPSTLHLLRWKNNEYVLCWVSRREVEAATAHATTKTLEDHFTRDCCYSWGATPVITTTFRTSGEWLSTSLTIV